MSQVSIQFDNVAAVLSMLALALDDRLPVPLLHPWVTDPGTGHGMKIHTGDRSWHAGHLPYAVSCRELRSESSLANAR
jgi:hypothetical protein